jgi:LPS export ABC transporter protein LptC
VDRFKFLLLLGFAGLSLVTVILFMKRGAPAYDPMAVLEALPQHVDMQVAGVNYTEVSYGDHRWNLKAAVLRYLKSEEIMVFDRVEAVFHNEDGPMRVTCEVGFYYVNDGLVRLAGNVRAMDEKGRRLATRELTYHIDSKIVSAPGHFQLTGPQVDLEGRNLVMDTKSNHFMVSGRPTLLFKEAKEYL